MHFQSKWTKLALIPVLALSVNSAGDDFSQHEASSIDDLVSRTRKAAPSGAKNDRTNIGIGERVIVSLPYRTWSDTDCNTTDEEVESDSMGEVGWMIDGQGRFTNAGDHSRHVTAKFEGGSLTITAEIPDSGRKFKDDTITKTLNFTVKEPTGETTEHVGWARGRYGGDGPNRNELKNGFATFKQTLTPSDVSFGNIKVKEVEAGRRDGANDMCHFEGSIYDPWDWLSGGTWEVEDDNTWGTDDVGWFESRIEYYSRNLGDRASCSTTLNQKMIVVESGKEYGAGGEMVLTIRPTGIDVLRNGVTASRELGD